MLLLQVVCRGQRLAPGGQNEGWPSLAQSSLNIFSHWPAVGLPVAGRRLGHRDSCPRESAVVHFQ
jgi:hypothetical protein